MDDQAQVSVDQAAPEPVSTSKWLPFGLTWKIAWKWSTIVMPILCVLSFLGLGFGIYAALSAAQFHPLILTAWVLIDVLLWIVVIVHTVVDLLVIRQWNNGDWDKAINGYTMTLLIVNAMSLLFGGGFLTTPSGYGVSSFCLLISLGILTFMDIWVMNHMKEKKVAEAIL